MRRFAKLFLWLAGLYLGIMLLAGFAMKVLLSGSRMNVLLSSLNSSLPVRVAAQGGAFDLLEWLRFRPSITIRDITISNPEGFSPKPMLAAREASAQVALLSLFSDRLNILRFTLREPELSIEQNSSGLTNVEAVARAVSARRSPAAAAPAVALAIGSLSLESGTVRYSGGGAPSGLTIRDIDLTLSDFAAERTCRINLAARMFQGKDSRATFRGTAGPVGGQALPAQGDLSIVLAPAEIPAGLRSELFGDLLREPPAASRTAFDAAMRGDLMGSLAGNGRLVLSGFEVGKDRASGLALAGEAPLQLSLERILIAPSFRLSTRGAGLHLGRGRWNGSLDVRYASGRMNGASKGSVTGVQINEMIRAFTSSREVVFGRAEIPEYSLQFSGKDANEIRESLSGQGRIRVEEGRVTLFNLLDNIRRQAQRLFTGAATREGQTDFTRLASDFEIRGGKVLLSGLRLESPASVIEGAGEVGFDQSLSFDLVADITGDLAARLGGKPDGSGTARLRVPVKVRGSMNSPQVYPDVAGLAKERAVEKARGLLDSLLKKRTEAPK